jgi:ABC-2 type transport system permease protein
MAILYSLWLRQLKRYFRSKARIIGSLGQPLLFLVALGFGFGPIYAKAGGGNYINFLAPGVIGMAILFTSVFAGIEVIWDKQFGFLKEMLVAPVSRVQIMLGRTLGGATVAVFQGLIVFLLSFLIGFRPTNWALVPLSLVVMFMIALVFTALGTAIASMLDDMQGFQLIINFLVMPLFFLSGALFPLGDAPGLLTDIARADPLTYGVDALRATLTGASQFGLALDFAVLAGVVALFLGIGSYLFKKIQI